MLLSRFWYAFLAVTAVAAVAAAMLAQGIINDRADRNLEDQLRRDRFELEAMLRVEARSRLDRIAFASVDSKLGGLLRQMRGVEDETKLREANTALKEVMRGHVDQLIEATPGPDTREQKRTRVAPDIAFALDGSGRIIAQLGPMEANPPGAALTTFPLIKRALQGYVRDDVWVYDRRVYRMAARPVLDGSSYAGAIVHGYRFDAELTQTLAKNLDGASVTFFYGTNSLASFVPSDLPDAPPDAELLVPLETVFADAKFKAGQRTDPVALQSGGRAVYSRITGTASVANVGYVIARPRSIIASPFDLFENASEDDVKQLPKPLLAGGAVGLLLLGMLFMFLEHDRPFKLLAGKTLEIGKGERDRLVITEWRGGYRKLADVINQAIEKEVEKAAATGGVSRKKANIDQILGPSQPSGGGYFGFAKDDADTESKPPMVAGGSPIPAPGSSPFIAPASSPKIAATSSPGLPPAGPPKIAATSSPGIAPPGPPNVAPPGPKPAAKPAAPAPVAAAAVAPDGADLGFDQEAHFAEVFEDYVKMRAECGEETDSLKFEKFVLTLRKNRDQIVEKHQAVGVRFTVYAKEGKAALKASPVKA
jgi:hypothetical protein